jgi:DNA-binding transcriptional LysR family regulator
VTLDQLRVFVAVAERQHVTRAARALNLAQSAASAAIAALEERYGTRLFHRVGRGIEMTEAGRVFLLEAKAVLARAAAAELALEELGGLRRGTLSLQASQTIASYWLPRHLVAFRRRHPGIEIRLAVGNTEQVARAVHDGAAELGFVEGAVEDPLLASTHVASDRMVVVVPAGHPRADEVRFPPRGLAELDWILREPGSGTRSEFEAALAEFGLAPGDLRVVLELPSNESVRAAVEAGAGAATLSELVVTASLRTGVLARLDVELPERAFHVLNHRERRVGRVGEALLAIIQASDG